VLLAVDNSQSMSSMGAAEYAREALATLWKALGQLEVGEVGVLRFGDDAGPALLHPMAAPLSDALGAQVTRMCVCGHVVPKVSLAVTRARTLSHTGAHFLPSMS
jgi:midasin (ATPase involved in ribosome maturation)